MPELPEVERARQLAEEALAGRRIENILAPEDDKIFGPGGAAGVRRALTGRHVVKTARWGKYLWLELDRPPYPVIHLGMSGALRVPGDDPVRLKSAPDPDRTGWPPRFWRCLIGTAASPGLCLTDPRRFSRVFLRACPPEEPPLSKLGADPLLAPLTGRVFAEHLRSRNASVKSILLDQRFCPGIGNWLADEILFQAGIDPRRPGCGLSHTEALRIRRKLLVILRRAVEANADDGKYPRSWLFHHRWARGGTGRGPNGVRLERISIGGRTTAWAPTLQK